MSRRSCRALTLAVVLSITVSACAGARPHPGAPAATSAGKQTSIGHGVTLSAVAVPPRASASVAHDVRLPGRGVVRSLAPVYRMTPSGALPGLTTITLPLTRPAPPGEQVLVATAETARGPWSYLPGTLSADRRTVTFLTRHFSFFWPGGINLDGLVRAVRRDFVDVVDSGLTASVDQPACGHPAAARSDGYSIASTNSATVKWCFGRPASGRILTVADNRQYPLELTHPRLSVVSLTNPAGLDSLSRAYSGGYTILEPGGQVTYAVTVPAGATGGISTQADLFGEDMYALQSGIMALVAIVSRLGLAELRGAQAIFAELVSIGSCAASLSQGIPAMLAACLDTDQLSRIFGAAIGVLLAAVMAVTSVIQFFRSEADVAKDQLDGKDGYDIAITHAAAASCSAQELGQVARAYMVAHGQGGLKNEINAYACDQGYAEILFTASPGGMPSYQAAMAFRSASGGWQRIGGADYIPPGSFGMPVSVGQTLVTALQANAGGDTHVSF